jgi:hypothetical protein
MVNCYLNGEEDNFKQGVQGDLNMVDREDQAEGGAS